MNHRFMGIIALCRLASSGTGFTIELDNALSNNFDFHSSPGINSYDNLSMSLKILRSMRLIKRLLLTLRHTSFPLGIGLILRRSLSIIMISLMLCIIP
jgi:hypothetical protein